MYYCLLFPVGEFHSSDNNIDSLTISSSVKYIYCSFNNINELTILESDVKGRTIYCFQ